MITTVRQAKLRPGRADRYPILPADMWTSAACVAELVTSYRQVWLDPAEMLGKARTLVEVDFEFRGGYARSLHEPAARTRTGDSDVSF